MIRGWRLYSVVDLDGRLSLCGLRSVAPSDVPARCVGGLKCTETRLVRSADRQPPTEACTCGYHMVRERDDLQLAVGWERRDWCEIVEEFIGPNERHARRAVLSAEPGLFGSYSDRDVGTAVAVAVTGVVAWGKVIPHERGWRVQHVRPEHVYELLLPPWEQDGSALPAWLRASFPELPVDDRIVRTTWVPQIVWGVLKPDGTLLETHVGASTIGSQRCRFYVSHDLGQSWEPYSGDEVVPL